MKDKNEQSLAYKFGTIFACFIGCCAMAILAALTFKLIIWII